ncbi:lysozyme inhibitor LprI family protein [Neopusillimonas aromaticivorans]|uniref:lysozyme inhibitor LprI family protein n=1 Tax=Neopusillimonas aromaticivorans TaxID=2979868 RepID=UPI0025951DD8|nr:lysozyme inhibitor LprI family protein [Neopusillimonas aromaticivorans]WJJ93967.1 lysozyme inhibitor LprI family protein [Neopusillimonas aromaticivorans]
MRNYFVATALFAVLLSGVANAETAPDSVQYSKTFTSCMDKSGGVTVEMIDCMNAELVRQDAKLNAEYTLLMGSLSAERKTQLRSTQRAWITYRDENCNFYYDPEGGSLARVQANMCMLQMTAERAGELALFNELY